MLDHGPVLVVGATGNVGGATAAALVERGVPVRAAGRDVARVRAAVPGARAVHLDLDDPATFAAAVDGVDGLFLLRPPPVARVGPTLNALVDAAVAAGVSHVVFCSVAGAERNRLVPHHRVEAHLAGLGVPSTILRPGFFAQNLTGPYREDVRDDDRLFVPAGGGRVAFVDVRDVGEVAADVLADPTGHVGAAHRLTGPEAVSFDDVARILSAALGRTVRYEPASVPAYVRHLLRRGLPLTQVVVQTLLHTGLRRGAAEDVDPTLERLLGRRPRTIADLVEDRREVW